MLNMDNLLGSRPQDQMRAMANMCSVPSIKRMYERAADQLDALNTRAPDISLPAID